MAQKLDLGSQEVVGGLIADYCMFVRDLLLDRARGALTTKEFAERVRHERDRLAVIIAGEDPLYVGIKSWSGSKLGFRLRVVLGTYWQQNRIENDNCPYKAVFSWLCWAVFDSLEQAGGDQDREGSIMSAKTGEIISILLGPELGEKRLSNGAQIR
jgi:hypothetical protein